MPGPGLTKEMIVGRLEDFAHGRRDLRSFGQSMRDLFIAEYGPRECRKKFTLEESIQATRLQDEAFRKLGLQAGSFDISEIRRVVEAIPNCECSPIAILGAINVCDVLKRVMAGEDVS